MVARARRLERFLTQPFFTTEQFTGLEGKLVSLEDALDGCERILRDEFKDSPESALYMIGAIDEARATRPGRARRPAGSRTVPRRMNLEILLPFEVFAEKTGVSRIVAETPAGLVRPAAAPARLCAALAPGILIYQTAAEGEVCVAVDDGRARQGRPGCAGLRPPRHRRRRPRPAARRREAGVPAPGRAGTGRARGAGQAGDGLPAPLRELAP